MDAIKKDGSILKGWNSVYDADPEKCLKQGYDKVVLVTRSLTELCKAHAKYFRQCFTIDDYIKLGLIEPDFFINVQTQFNRINKEIDDPRLLKLTLEDWNNYTYYCFNNLLDFLEFPFENRPLLIPVKFTAEQRDFEGYSCSHLPKNYEVCEPIQIIRGRKV